MAGFATNTPPADRAQVLIVDSTFETTNTNAGFTGGNATVQDSHFERNTATSGGGAIRNHYRLALEPRKWSERSRSVRRHLSDGIMEIEGSLISNTGPYRRRRRESTAGRRGTSELDTDPRPWSSSTAAYWQIAVGNGNWRSITDLTPVATTSLRRRGGGVLSRGPGPRRHWTDNRRGETSSGSTFSGNQARAGAVG